MKKRFKKSRKKIFRRELILERLIEAGETTVEKLLNLFLFLYKFGSAMTLPYAQSYRAIKKLSFSEDTLPRVDLKTRATFLSLLLRLEKDGFIYKNSKEKIAITSEGKDYLQNKIKTPPWFKNYKPVKISGENKFFLIIFDIPEKERYKRDWLRFQLLGLGFGKLQQSVWWGNNLLPEDFIKDLENYRILSYVHILSINKKGTISKFLDEIKKES